MNLDGLCLHVRTTDSVGVVSAETRLRLTQRGTRILGRYEGGAIVRGCLVGEIGGDTLAFRYAQREREGGIHAGHSRCDVEVLNDGRLRIHEHFTWMTRDGSGTNIFDQLS